MPGFHVDGHTYIHVYIYIYKYSYRYIYIYIYIHVYILPWPVVDINLSGHLCSHYAEQLSSKKHTDVTFCIDSNKVTAHR